MQSYCDPFWVNDVLVLMRIDRMVEFYPSIDMTANERMNAITRFIIYSGLCISFIKKTLKPFAIALAMIATLAFLYYPKSDKEMLDEYHKNKPNNVYSNPFSNLLPLDPNYAEKKNKPPSHYNGEYERKYQESSDFYKTDDGKQFHGVPSHTSDEYLRYLYDNNMGKCKNGESLESCQP